MRLDAVTSFRAGGLNAFVGSSSSIDPTLFFC